MFGLYSHQPDTIGPSSVLENWLPSQLALDPLQQLAQSLLTFCFPDEPTLPSPGPDGISEYQELKGILTGENVKAFLHDYRHFNSHWPLIHTPSLDPFSANRGLIVVMCCVGAVYSNKLLPEESRRFMEIVRPCVHQASRVYRLIQQSHAAIDLCNHLSDVTEELLAIALLHCLFIWHGSPKQRQQAREELWILADGARRAGLLAPLPSGNPNASALHQLGPVTGDEVNSWSWTVWVENEKRTRLMSFIFLLDACSIMFLNARPHFDVYEITGPLPADDAAWEAKTAEDCASALGLRGEAAQVKNESGSRRAKQLGLSEALQVLHGAGHAHFPERATNAFGKFLLVHAIILQICDIQRQLLRRLSTSSVNTPPSQSSSPATPVSAVSEQTQQLRRSIMSALELWKICWDKDLAIQFPTPAQRRCGFCRDGVHYFFLAQLFLRKSRPEEWAAPADIRCQRVFNLLKYIRAHVASDSAQKGIDIGSVTQIADDFAIADLTLDMKRLFTPIEER